MPSIDGKRPHPASLRSPSDRWPTPVGCLLVGLCCWLLAAPLVAQELPGVAGSQDVAPAPEGPRREAIAERQAALATELTRVEKAIDQAADADARAHLAAVRDALHRIETTLRKQADLSDAPPIPAPESSLATGASSPSVFTLNRLYEARVDAEQRRKRVAESLEVAREALAEAKERSEEAERERRKARAELEAAGDAQAKLRAERASRPVSQHQ